MKVQSYKELIVWQQGIKITDLVYQATEKFPANEQYGLATQMRRSAVSIPSNMAEGFTRNYTKEYIQFLYIAMGSCSELNTQWIIAEQRKYTDGKIYEELSKLLDS